MTLHSAFKAHAPGQGFLHFWFKHAKWFGHSLFVTHSGRQFGGVPTKSGRQVQDGISPFTWHWAFTPHGEGTQGFIGSDVGGSAAVK